MRTSRLFLASGLIVSLAFSALGFLIPGGGWRWFLHTPAGQFGLPVGLALLAAGAVLGRLERAEVAAEVLRSTTERLLSSPTPVPPVVPSPISTQLSNDR